MSGGYPGHVTVRKAVVAGILLIATWMVGYALFARAPDDTAYRTLCVRAAQSALDGLETTRLAADERGQSKIPATTATSLIDDAGTLIGDAQSTVAGVAPPDSSSIALRDELAPLLAQADAAYGDIALARAGNNRPAWQAALARLTPLAEKLRAFIERHR